MMHLQYWSWMKYRLMINSINQKNGDQHTLLLSLSLT
jgi:hypothetical protein